MMIFELGHKYGKYYVLNRKSDSVLVTNGKKLTNHKILIDDNGNEYFIVGESKRVRAK